MQNSTVSIPELKMYLDIKYSELLDLIGKIDGKTCNTCIWCVGVKPPHFCDAVKNSIMNNKVDIDSKNPPEWCPIRKDSNNNLKGMKKEGT